MKGTAFCPNSDDSRKFSLDRLATEYIKKRKALGTTFYVTSVAGGSHPEITS